ncbi:hypothetical protein G6F63_015513 [Rhizopus arrhizus]|nr:hypothetical protein G6F63_015513 [Rhizopus arrhizus]
MPVGLGDFQRGGRCARHAVETLRVFHQRGVAAGAHVGQDAGGGAVDGLVLGGLEGQQLGQGGFESGIAGVETIDQGHGVMQQSGKRPPRVAAGGGQALREAALSKASSSGATRSA